MPEPVITPLAAFGLSLTILNFFISTIENLLGKYREIKDYQQMLGDLRRDLFVSARSYDLWLDIWGSNEQSYEKVFGIDWPEIKKTKQRIESLVRDTAKLLCLDTPLPPSPSQESKVSTASTTLHGHEAPTPNQTSPTPGSATNDCKSKLGLFSRISQRPTGSKAKTTANDGPIALELEADKQQGWKSFTKSLSEALSKQPDHAMVDQAAKKSSWDKLMENVSNLVPGEEEMRRILGIFGWNKVLKATVSDLEKALKSLTEHTKIAIESQGHRPVPTERHKVTAIEDAIDFRDIARTLEPIVRGQIIGSTGVSKWFLELKYPDGVSDGSAAARRIFKECDFSFVATLAIPDGPDKTHEVKMTRLKGRLVDEANAPNMSLESAMTMFQQPSKLTFKSGDTVFKLQTTKTSPTLITQDWRVLLTECGTKSDVRKALELTRARFALGLTLWMILLWESDWFTHVCACAFKCVLFPSSGCTGERETQYEDEDQVENHMNRHEHIYNPTWPQLTCPPTLPIHQNLAIPLASETNIVPSCRGRTELKDRLYHFGILLSELVLGQPIDLTSDVNHIPNTRTKGRPRRRFEASDEILDEVKSPKVRDAIYFCFTQDMVQMWTDKDKNYAPGRLNRFIEEVLKPVIEYHDVVKKNFKKHYAEMLVTSAKMFPDKYEQFETLLKIFE
ncbi:uncharacterized protein BKA55DRAFT_679820 [Fusarium redolens]|uniref:Uncharacterized protein n=1 Tax=Fusarium redolens TaxID=48865 RepID=A0A9P9G671_FUSRE|nr:uncharacterized protein BKA55DRAFT_679820 [Fusarium redolens]KAH7233830.1 hypothetical protein BKA55DRAFT_679820 [Fusarium redolens]